MSSVETAEAKHGRERAEAVEKIDFKMVTFSLAGKDYGIDIMKVKEIAKFGNFTYVPNTPPFVAGVYNLRGDIISIIDLRLMFNLPVDGTKKGVEDGLILRLDNNQIGVIVDQIDKVVGIPSSSIQPPHPIFGDINIKYISGVVENEGRLYIILDVERIFTQDAQVPPVRSIAREPLGGPAKSPGAMSATVDQESVVAKESASDQEVTFVSETLNAYKGFHTTELNRKWVENRLGTWRTARSEAGKPAQLTHEDDATAFLSDFHSPHAGEFWGPEYEKAVAAILVGLSGGTISVWNPGCGKGFETYSLAVALRNTHRDARIKVWASDKDLLGISTAPNLVFANDDVPNSHRPYVSEGSNGLSFTASIKDLILFEYHDVLHTNAVPDADVVMARDLLSFLSPDDQIRIIEEFEDKLKQGGILILGTNERLAGREGFEDVSRGSVSAYRKR